MSGRAYKEILEKYLNGTATEEELKVLEQHADEMIERSQTEVFLSEEEKSVVKNELRERVKIKKARTIPLFTRIAASVALIAGVSMALWFAVDQSSSVQMATVSTGVGEHKTVALPDGSEIVLNAKSTLQYPEEFETDSRQVKLKGEALFSVAKDSERPFEVTANGITTTVLGTVFNVDAYSGDSMVKVSLLEGSVRVQGLDTTMLIKPLQQSNFNLKTKKAGVAVFDSTAVMAWKRGDLVLSKTRFDELLRIVERRYGAKVKLQSQDIAGYTISGKFRNPSIQTLLESICATKSLQFKETAPSEFLIY